MLAKSCPKVSLQSCLSRESYDKKFGMDECARNNYGVTLKSIAGCYSTCMCLSHTNETTVTLSHKILQGEQSDPYNVSSLHNMALLSTLPPKLFF